MKMTEFVYKYKNKDIVVHVTRSMQRNIYFRYKEDGFHVSAPYLTSQKQIVNGLDHFADKLLSQYEKSHSNFSFENDFVYILGEQYSLKSLEIENYQELQDFLQKKAVISLTELVRKNEEIMGISIPYKVRIKSTERQFGSNSKRTHSLSFQLDLIHYSKEIIESVVVHELAHEFERNHGKNFYNIVYSYCPNYKELQKKLKKGIHKWLLKLNLGKINELKI